MSGVGDLLPAPGKPAVKQAGPTPKVEGAVPFDPKLAHWIDISSKSEALLEVPWVGVDE